MDKTSQIRAAAFCRRSFLHGLVLVASGLATLGVMTPANRLAAAECKATQQSVDYREAAKGASVCSNCKYFQAPSSCYIVEGTIAPGGWCNKYAR